MNNPNKVAVIGNWLIKSDRKSVYAIISDWERFPEYFPEIARSVNIIHREGNTLTIDADAASFGKLFPTVKIRVVAELLPDNGYRCSTHNITFNTTGEEQLLLFDDPAGTRIEYTYFVTVKICVFYASSRRIRIGDYRVVYSIVKSALVIEIIRIGHRKDVYKET